MKTVIRQGHQGDVSFTKTNITFSEFDKLVTNENIHKPRMEGGLVILEGEGSGHLHTFRDPSKVQAIVMAANDEREKGLIIMLVKVMEPTVFEHYNENTKELTYDHDSIRFDPAVYRFTSQREWSIERSFRPVVD